MGLRKASEGQGLRPIQQREYPREVTGLYQQLQDPDPAVRRWAVRDLSGHPESVGLLCGHLLSEHDHAVRESVFTALIREGTDEVATGLIPLLRSEDPTLRNACIEALACMAEAVAPHIDKLLTDVDEDVRIFTLNVIKELRHPDVTRWTNRVLEHDPHVNVVAAALDVVAECGSTESRASIQKARLRFEDNPFIVFAADLAQQRIETP